MRTTTTTAAVGAALLLAATLTACGGGGGSNSPAPAKSPTASAPSAAPTLSKAEVSERCTDAVAEAAPGWDDWNFDLGGWQDDPRTPEACQGLVDEEFPPRGNRAFQDALIDGLDIAAACGTPAALPGKC